MLVLYFLNTVLVVLIVLAAVFPKGARRVLEGLGLWPLVAAIDRRRFQKMLEILGTFLVVMALALIASILLGGHGSDWALPAGEAIFFGAALILVARWSGKAPPDS